VELFRARTESAAFAGTEAIMEKFAVFPSHLAAGVLAAYEAGDPAGAVVPFLRLLCSVLAAGVLLYILSRWYLPVWQKLQEGRFHAEPAASRDVSDPVRFPRYFTGQTGALFEKEWLTLVRTPRNALWLGFMLLLWMVQAGLNAYIRHSLVKYRVNLEEAVHILEALQVVVAVYFMSAFILRFVFPAFSIERKTAWIVASAPLDLARVYRAKFMFYAIVFLLIGGGVAAMNIAVLDLPLAEAALFFSLIFVAIAFLTALGLAIGALFPNFETDDPEILSTSMPGLGLTVLCLAYGALGAGLLYEVLGGASLVPLAGFLAASLLGICVLAGFPPRSLQRMEFGVDN
jgi:ABC-2 type transport system permease protein